MRSDPADNAHMYRIKEFRELKGMSQSALATAVGLNQSEISRIEKGERRLRADLLVVFAKALEVDPVTLLGNDNAPTVARPYRSPPPPHHSGVPGAYDVPVGERDLPVFGVATGGDGNFLLPSDDRPLDWTYRPPQLRGVADAFAVFVRGDSMRPMFRPGQALWIHPHLPPIPEEGVLIVKNDDLALVKEFVRGTATEIVVREYWPAQRDFSIPRHEIRHSYRVIGAFTAR